MGKQVSELVDDCIKDMKVKLHANPKVRAKLIEHILEGAQAKLTSGRWSMDRHYSFIQRLDQAGL